MFIQMSRCVSSRSERKNRGVENSGEGKTYHKRFGVYQEPCFAREKGGSLHSPEKGNVDKMSKKVEKCPKNCPEGLTPQFSDFWDNFCPLVDALVWRPCPMLKKRVSQGKKEGKYIYTKEASRLWGTPSGNGFCSCVRARLNFSISGPFALSNSTQSVPNMIGRPGCRTFEMNGRSSASHLACTPCVPFSFVHCLIRVEQRGFQTTRGGLGSLPLYGGTFARSYSVSKKAINTPPRNSWPRPIAGVVGM